MPRRHWRKIRQFAAPCSAASSGTPARADSCVQRVIGMHLALVLEIGPWLSRISSARRILRPESVSRLPKTEWLKQRDLRLDAEAPDVPRRADAGLGDLLRRSARG